MGRRMDNVLFSGLALEFDLVAGRDSDYELAVLPGPTPGPTPTTTPSPFPYVPTLNVSYREGPPDSVIAVTGSGFPQCDEVSIWLNGRSIGAVPGYGWFQFQLDNARAAEGWYIIVAQAGPVTAAEFFRVDAQEAVREPVGDGPVFADRPLTIGSHSPRPDVLLQAAVSQL